MLSTFGWAAAFSIKRVSDSSSEKLPSIATAMTETVLASCFGERCTAQDVPWLKAYITLHKTLIKKLNRNSSINDSAWFDLTPLHFQHLEDAPAVIIDAVTYSDSSFQCDFKLQFVNFAFKRCTNVIHNSSFCFNPFCFIPLLSLVYINLMYAHYFVLYY